VRHLLLALVCCNLIYSSVWAKVSYPRQKISITGGTHSSPVALTIKDLEAYKKQDQITIHDPYNKDILTTFYGFYMKDFLNLYAPPAYKSVRVTAIDGYKVDIPKQDIDKSNLFMSYKDKAGFLTVDRMGPARIIAPFKGVINRDLLLQLGVYWVWQVKTIEFIK